MKGKEERRPGRPRKSGDPASRFETPRREERSGAPKLGASRFEGKPKRDDRGPRRSTDRPFEKPPFTDKPKHPRDRSAENPRFSNDRSNEDFGSTRPRRSGDRTSDFPSERPSQPFSRENPRFRETPTDRGPKPQRTDRAFPPREEKPNPDRARFKSFKRNKGDAFEYGKTVRPQQRPDYSEENLIRNLPEKQRNKIISSDKKTSDQIRLNRYIANAGLCSRREADDFIASGQITVNGKTVTEMGYQVKPTDVVKYGRKVLNREKLVYVLLNKPKDFITTTEDPEGRRTVMELVAKAGPERIYPVGRLDRATTGLLLFTNDGELADKLAHPSHEIRKIYQVEINKPLAGADLEKLIEGVELEDGFIKPDDVSVITPDQQVIGIEIHSGKNRIVRRLFEHLGYEVTQLDRTAYAGLTKKDLPRGNWRFLTQKEVIRLKYMI